jgi:rod shape-determining protein MreC
MSLSPHSRYPSLDRAPPSFSKQSTSALSSLIFFCAFAMFLMVADVRFQIAKPLRSILATTLYPLQWLTLQPLTGLQFLSHYFQSLSAAQSDAEDAHRKLTLQMQKATTVEQLQIENHRLRQLLDLKQRPETSGIPAEVIYDAADPYTRKIVLNKGTTQNISAGSPVLDEFGVVGQVTRTHPFTSEVTLLIDRDLAIPVLNTRTGARSVAYGDSLSFGGTLELRFMAANADVLRGDLLTTSGVDGVYPAGLPVAIIDKIERRADSPFAKIHCTPVARISGASHVMVLNPLSHLLQNTLNEKSMPITQSKRGAKQ